MTQSTQMTVTQLLHELEHGNTAALSELFPLVYTELQKLARRQRRRWHGDFTLNTTALVHEAYLKLVNKKRVKARSRTHFFAVAAKTMRHILCNYAANASERNEVAICTGSQWPTSKQSPRTSLFQWSNRKCWWPWTMHCDTSRSRPRLSDIVECRFFGAMSIADTASALGLSPATVKRHWALARSWLYREMQNPAAP